MGNRKLLLATKNPDKVKEIKQILDGLYLEILSAADFTDLPDVEENQDTLFGNAQKKAVTMSKALGSLALADDTGLEVDALDGAPGVLSARYAGKNATYSDNVEKLLRELQGVPEAERTARFRCVVAIADGDNVRTVEGVCEGNILLEPRGSGGFGYDPVFYIPEFKQTFAEMPLAEKNATSHRGQALRKARKVLQEIGDTDRP